VEYAGAVSAFFSAGTCVMNVSVFLTFSASGRDAQVFLYIDQVILDTNAVCKEAVG
jgi:hypothetical protein